MISSPQHASHTIHATGYKVAPPARIPRSFPRFPPQTGPDRHMGWRLISTYTASLVSCPRMIVFLDQDWLTGIPAEQVPSIYSGPPQSLGRTFRRQQPCGAKAHGGERVGCRARDPTTLNGSRQFLDSPRPTLECHGRGRNPGGGVLLDAPEALTKFGFKYIEKPPSLSTPFLNNSHITGPRSGLKMCCCCQVFA